MVVRGAGISLFNSPSLNLLFSDPAVAIAVVIFFSPLLLRPGSGAALRMT